MKTIALIGTAVSSLIAVTLYVGPADAERVCRQVCDDGFCQTRCFDRGGRVYLYDRDRDRDYYDHRRPGVEFHGPGFGVEIGR